MRYYPNMDDGDDKHDVEMLNAEQWQLDQLKLNPGYNSWGNYEDYMWNDSKGWQSACEVDGVDGLFKLNDLNECVNFYFTVTRKNEKCADCDGSGQNPATKEIEDTWYDFAETGKKWCYKITQDEVDALWDGGRLQHDFKAKPTAEQVNDWAQNRRGIGHDAINRWICVETRAKRLGVWGRCSKCGGSGRIYIEPKAKLQLQAWILHPRKGCSRGLFVKEIKQEELPQVYAWLRQARDRNAERFSKIPSE